MIQELQFSYRSDQKPVFCPGCGDFGVTAAVIKALTDLKIPRHNVVVVTGIGCSSSIAHQFATYGIHSLHGRLLPVAMGVKLANPKLTVIGAGGDGDGYGIGLNHLIHTARRNFDLTYIVMNNEIYGLTVGQYSPTSLKGMKTKSSPYGAVDNPVNPIALAITAGATYVARGFSGDIPHLAELIKNGILHKGFALIDVFSPCVTFNNYNTYDWFRERIYKLDSSNHNPKDISKALEKALEFPNNGIDRIPIGLFYEADRPTYEEEDITVSKMSVSEADKPSRELIEEILSRYR
ncbi:MAG: 2-oxoglutarate ferredoxin oxidoreductase subunit beta [Candidatus Micrarchaeota archaeon]|nr:MAG: 2-oxoglutarate ferredoxin oxidoreductase subunit beta [Candidatus Micrarchaeota archaeon]